MSRLISRRAALLSPDEVRLVEKICDRFEARWKEGRRELIGRYLDEAPERARGRLLRDLVTPEVEYRRHAGESPTPEEDLQRFPWDAEQGEAPFRPAVAGASPVSPASQDSARPPARRGRGNAPG